VGAGLDAVGEGAAGSVSVGGVAPVPGVPAVADVDADGVAAGADAVLQQPVRRRGRRTAGRFDGGLLLGYGDLLPDAGQAQLEPRLEGAEAG
jgi:hypothetical protein